MATDEKGADEHEGELQSLLNQERFDPPEDFVRHALVRDDSLHRDAERDPAAFWLEQARDSTGSPIPASRSTTRTPPSSSGSPTGRSTPPTTASTATSRPATAIASPSTGAARRARRRTGPMPTSCATSRSSPTG
jgi:hypothetical protein